MVTIPLFPEHYPRANASTGQDDGPQESSDAVRMPKGSVSVTSHSVALRTKVDDVLEDPESPDGDADGRRIQRTNVDRTELGEGRGHEGRLEERNERGMFGGGEGRGGGGGGGLRLDFSTR